MKTRNISRVLNEARVNRTLIWLMTGLLVVPTGCDRGGGPEEKITGKGQATVRFTVASVGYADGGEMTRSGQAEERVTGQAIVGDGEFLLDYTIERVPEAQTRAWTMADGTAVRVFVFDEDDKFVTSGIIYSGSGEGDGIALDAGKDYTIRAVSYNTTEAPNLSVAPGTPLASATMEVSPDNELLYAGAGSNLTLTNLQPGVTSVTLNFQHLFSMLLLRFGGTSYSQSITEFSPYLTPGGNTANLSLTGGTLTPTGAPQSRFITPVEPTPVYTGGATPNLNLSFTVVINGVPMSGAINSINKPFLPGYLYDMYVVLRMGGNRMPDVRIGSYWWAKSNLFETNTPGEYAMFNTEWEQGYTHRSGAYWNWGAVHPRKNHDAFWPNTPGYAVDWAAMPVTSATDPCHVASSGVYRLPTDTEVSALIKNYVFGAYSATIPAEGCWFGTTSLAAAQTNPGNYVFFPLTGYRDPGSTIVASHNYSGLYHFVSTNGGRRESGEVHMTGAPSPTIRNGISYFMNTGKAVRCVRN